MKYIYVGFKGKNNPSSYIATQFQESFLLTNSFQGIDKDIHKIEDCKDGIILFGLRPKLKNQIQVEQICCYNGNKISSKFDFSHLSQALKDFEVKFNKSPSKYLCNYAYYRLCEKFSGNVILLHIPFAKEFADKILQCLLDFKKRE